MTQDIDIETYISKIRKKISEPALYEQLAEECTELAQAALKKARKLRGENYTPNSMNDIDLHINEEYADVVVSATVCNLIVDHDIELIKTIRWFDRIIKE